MTDQTLSFTTRSVDQQILERELEVLLAAPPRQAAEEGTDGTAVDGVQALVLPGEEDRPLGVSLHRMLLVWTLATVVAVAYIGIPLTMFLVPLLGGTGSALLVAGSLVLIGVLAVRLVLRLISAHKVIGSHR